MKESKREKESISNEATIILKQIITALRTERGIVIQKTFLNFCLAEMACARRASTSLRIM